MVFFYFPFIRYVRLVLWAIIIGCLLLSSWWCFWLFYRPSLIAKDESMCQGVVPKSVEISPKKLFLQCACNAACVVRDNGQSLLIVGSAACIARCAWLCGVYRVPLYSYTIKPVKFSGRYRWRVVL